MLIWQPYNSQRVMAPLLAKLRQALPGVGVQQFSMCTTHGMREAATVTLIDW
jgi:hypothetical protein